MSHKDEQKSILERPLSKGNQEFSLSLYTLLFSEMIRYCQDRSTSLDEVSDMLANMGKDVGWRLMDLLYHREKVGFMYIYIYIFKHIYLKIFAF